MGTVVNQVCPSFNRESLEIIRTGPLIKINVLDPGEVGAAAWLDRNQANIIASGRG